MCGVCGCGDSATVSVEQDILSENKSYAEKNRYFFESKNILTINVMSSPGSGKTTLLTKTLVHLKGKIKTAVIVGDQQTECDAHQLKQAGVPAVQVNTGKVCHLDAHMIGHALEKLPITDEMTLFIENIGNLVCPVLFDLGESFRVVVLSVTEGDNKPLKYPDMFHKADLVIINKIDLLPYVQFDINACIKNIKQVNPSAKILQVSATTKDGLSDWYDWLSNCKIKENVA